jgi:propionate CoA-transferase
LITRPCSIGARYGIENGRLNINAEGKRKKLLETVDQVTFSGKYARSVGQPTLYVIERAVFQLVPEGMLLIEIAPGMDLQRDILDQMAFEPLISSDLKSMPEGIFHEKWGGLKSIVASP